jgi:hypothetical protein
MKTITTLLTVLAALALPGLESAANAQTTYFPTDTTIHDTVSGDAVVGRDSSRINLFGTNLTATETAQSGNFTYYTLSGKLKAGTDLASAVLLVNSSASYTLNPAGAPVPVPEPGSLALFCSLGVMGCSPLVRKRRP